MEEINPKKTQLPEKSVTSKENHCDDDDAIDASKLLTYDVWRLIFKYLNGKDFCAGSQVCRFWRDVIAKERELHGPFYHKAHPNQLTAERSKEILDDLKIKPEMVLVCSESLAGIVRPVQRTVCICKSLPKSCNMIYINSYEVVVKSKPEKPFPPGASIGCQFLPYFPRGFMTMYYFSFPNCVNLIPKLEVALRFKAGEKSKCFIMFSNAFVYRYIQSSLQSITYSRKDKQQSLAVIGGLVKNLYICKKEERSCRVKASCVVFALSNPGLESWSVVVPDECYNAESITKKLQELRNSIELKKYSAGFMFGCCARLDNKNVEVAAFENVFPEVPLMCCYGDGEYGVDTLDDDPTTADRKFVHQYTTVYLLVTYS